MPYEVPQNILIDSAIHFAVDAHAGQCRKGTKLPYILHPVETAAIAASLTGSAEVIAAAVLHDTMEDCGVSRDTLAHEFGERVASLVANESENKREDRPAADTWKLRKQETLDHLNSCKDIDVKIIAFSDKLANLRAIHRDHCKLGARLWERFNQSNPKEIRWYYEGVLLACPEFSGEPAYAEYRGLLDAVFGKTE